MKIVEYTVILDEGVRKRHIHTSQRGKILDFVVQLEVLIEVKWKPVIRYDCSHNFAHIDYYDLSGNKTKEPLFLNFNEALILADEGIKRIGKNTLENF